MRRLAVLASGNGSNFEALTIAARTRGHEPALLVCDRKGALVLERSARLGVPSRYVCYAGRSREEAEAEIDEALRASGADFVALAGFMRLLSPAFVREWRGRLVNVHPSLLPAYPGARAIERAYGAGERRFGVTVHYVDEGMDSGLVIAQRAFEPEPGTSLAEIERRIHELEHELYPEVVFRLMDEGGLA